jgi:phospholipase C
MFRSKIQLLLLVLLAACASNPPIDSKSKPFAESVSSTFTPIPTITSIPASTSVPTATPKPLIPSLDHIVIIIFENKEYGKVIGNPQMPTFNKYAKEYTLLTQFYAVAHPSLPNYLALVSGDTFHIDSDCDGCFISAPNLPDLIEASGRTWKTYQEGIPEPCYLGDHGKYAQKHNPFIYFDSIRLDPTRCQKSIVPLKTLRSDIEAHTLPNFIFITPDLCHTSHDCTLDKSDDWLAERLPPLQSALDQEGSNYLIILTWDEGQGDHSCCGLPQKAGGRIAVVLISPLVKSNYEDATPYTHYSLLKTISNAWGLEYLGYAADPNQRLIIPPFE